MKKKLRLRGQTLFIIIFAILAVYLLIMLLPMLWAIVTALKDQAEFRLNVLGLPHGAPWSWKWSNFVQAAVSFEAVVTVADVGRFKVGFWGMLGNSLLYAVGSALIQTFVPCVVAYVTAKFPCKFSSFLTGLVLVLMAMPIIGSQASELQLLKSLNMWNTMWGVYILKFNFLGLYFLIFQAAFKSMPNDFLEAAYIDGASEFRVMVSIALPMAANIIGTVFLLKFIAFWNDYESVLMYMPAYPTLANGVFNLGAGTQGINAEVPFKMAGCMVLVLPILVLFSVFSKRLMGNLSMGGIKE